MRGLCVLFLIFFSVLRAQVRDSLYYVVKEDDTWYGIAKRYRVALDSLQAYNKAYGSSGLRIGDTLYIPMEVVKTSKEKAGKGGYHTVRAKETLYGLSRRYGVALDSLRSWNNIDGSVLRIGQVLRLSASLDVRGVSGQPILASIDTLFNAAYAFRKRREEGFAIGIQDKGQGLYALHRLAPVGMLIKVSNQMNGRTIFARVVGRLPNLERYDKYALSLSKKAYALLGTSTDKQIPVSIEYMYSD